MNSIVFFAEKGDWTPDVWVTLMKGVISDNNQFVVETSDSWIGIHRCDDVFSDCDEDEEQFVRSLLHDPISYLIEWRGDDLLSKFVTDFPPNKNAVIDNDHGLICNIAELKNISISDWLYEKKIARRLG